MRLATITAAAVLASAMLLYFSLWIAEAIAKAEVSRIEITQNEVTQ